MGNINEIADASTGAFEEYLGKNVAENMTREYFNGYSYGDDEDNPEGAIVWRFAGLDSIEDTESEIVFFRAVDKQAGEELIEKYSDRVDEDEIKRSYFELKDIEQEMIEVLKNSGFAIKEKEGRDIYASISDVAKNKVLMPKKPPKHVVPISEMQLLQFRQGITNCLFSGVTGLNEDLALLPREWFEQDVSCAFMQDDKAIGFFLVHALPDSSLMPVLLYASGVDARQNILSLIRYSALASARKYEAATRIIIRRHDEKTRKLSSYLFPNFKGEKVLVGERKEG